MQAYDGSQFSEVQNFEVEAEENPFDGFFCIDDILLLLKNCIETGQPVILTRNGQPIAALFSIESIDLESLSLSLNPTFTNIDRTISKKPKRIRQNHKILYITVTGLRSYSFVLPYRSF